MSFETAFGFLVETITLILQAVVGLALLAGACALIWAITFGGEMHPQDADKPLRLQRIKFGSFHKSYGPRWHGWLGAFVTLAPAPSFLLYHSIWG